MDPISDFSAAPHLPLSLRELASSTVRPELALMSLTASSQQGRNVVVMEHNGEIYIAFANAA
jgi:hypothetical protein